MALDFAGPRELMGALVDVGPTPSGGRTPTVIASLHLFGPEEATVTAGGWMVQEAPGQGVHEVHLARARDSEGVKRFGQAAGYPIHKRATDTPGVGLRGWGGHRICARAMTRATAGSARRSHPRNRSGHRRGHSPADRHEPAAALQPRAGLGGLSPRRRPSRAGPRQGGFLDSLVRSGGSGGFAFAKMRSQASRIVGPGSSGMTRFGRPRGRFFFGSVMAGAACRAGPPRTPLA